MTQGQHWSKFGKCQHIEHKQPIRCSLWRWYQKSKILAVRPTLKEIWPLKVWHFRQIRGHVSWCTFGPITCARVVWVTSNAHRCKDREILRQIGCPCCVLNTCTGCEALWNTKMAVCEFPPKCTFRFATGTRYLSICAYLIYNDGTPMCYPHAQYGRKSNRHRGVKWPIYDPRSTLVEIWKMSAHWT